MALLLHDPGQYALADRKKNIHLIIVCRINVTFIKTQNLLLPSRNMGVHAICAVQAAHAASSSSGSGGRMVQRAVTAHLAPPPSRAAFALAPHTLKHPHNHTRTHWSLDTRGASLHGYTHTKVSLFQHFTALSQISEIFPFPSDCVEDFGRRVVCNKILSVLRLITHQQAGIKVITLNWSFIFMSGKDFVHLLQETHLKDNWK